MAAQIAEKEGHMEQNVSERPEYGKQQTLSAKSDTINIEPVNGLRLSWSH